MSFYSVALFFEEINDTVVGVNNVTCLEGNLISDYSRVLWATKSKFQICLRIKKYYPVNKT